MVHAPTLLHEGSRNIANAIVHYASHGGHRLPPLVRDVRELVHVLLPQAGIEVKKKGWRGGGGWGEVSM